MKPNDWLVDETYIAERVKFEDMEYFHTLTDFIHKQLRIWPIPVITTWDPKGHKIWFTVGISNKWEFKVDVNFSTHDFMRLVEQSLRKLFPQFKITETSERNPTAEEVERLLTQGRVDSVDDAFNYKVKESKVDVGMIERVYLLDDQFRLNRNGKRAMYISTQPLSQFLRTFRTLRRDDEKRAFIIAMSKFISEVKDRDVEIKYEGEMLINFFKINRIDLGGVELKIGQDPLKGFWKNYIIHFPSEEVRKQCLLLIDYGKTTTKN